MKQLLFLLCAAAVLRSQQWDPASPHWGADYVKRPGVMPLDPRWQIKGYGPTPDPVCISLRDVWIMPDGSYRYCNNGAFVNPFAAVQLSLATSSADGLLAHGDFLNLRALQSAAFQPVSAFDPAGAAASAQVTAISTAQTNTNNALAALGLKSASQQLSTAFDPAGAAAAAVAALPLATASLPGLLSSSDWITFNSKQNALGFMPLSPSANLSELSNSATARINLGLGSAATQPSSAFDVAGAAVGAVAGIPVATSSVNGLLNKTDWIAFNAKQAPLGFTPLNPANALSELSTSQATARTNLGLAPVSASGSYTDLSNKPTIPAAQVAIDWNATTGLAAILNKPILGTAATANTSAFDAAGVAAAAVAALPTAARTGSYNDLTSKPTIPAAQVNSDWSATTGLGQILNKPTLGTASAQNTSAFDAAGLAASAQSASLQKSANLSDLGSVSTAQSNLLGAWQSWTPTVTPFGSMTASNLTVTDAQYLRLGPICFFKLYVTMTLGGTTDVAVYISAPLSVVGPNSAVTALINTPGTGSNYYSPQQARTDATYGFLVKNATAMNSGTNIFLLSGFYRVQ